MKQTLLGKYPIFVVEISKEASDCANVADVVAHLKARIAERETVQFLGVYDHHAHTGRIGGEIAANIVGAVNVLFCFGTTLTQPQILAVRPRSIGVVDLGDKFVVSFLEAPSHHANEAMQAWINGLRRT